MKTIPRRYNNLFSLIQKYKPKTICEIGVYDGKHALQMINEAEKYNQYQQVVYYGFDLFGDITPEQIEHEHSKKSTFDYLTVLNYLQKNTKSKIHLIPGNTHLTLPGFIPEQKLDFIFIDGGHSLETIQNDWDCLKRLCDENTIVVFDDYYIADETKGCKSLIDHLPFTKWEIQKLDPIDKFPDKSIQMVMVRKI